jgi:TRAP-type mannitol/chloroaromatic compound transport system permease small subunit
VGALVRLSRTIDGRAALLGRWVSWLVVAAIVISAATPSSQLWNTSSNAWLEMRWLLFGRCLLAAPGRWRNSAPHRR